MDQDRQRLRYEPEGLEDVAVDVSDARGTAFRSPPGRSRRAVVNVADLLAESEAEFDARIKTTIRLIGWRSALSVPMLRDGEIVGAVTVNRSVPDNLPKRKSTCFRRSRAKP